MSVKRSVHKAQLPDLFFRYDVAVQLEMESHTDNMAFTGIQVSAPEEYVAKGQRLLRPVYTYLSHCSTYKYTYWINNCLNLASKSR